MQPLNEILKEIGLPVWVCWGTSALIIVVAIVASAPWKGAEAKTWLSVFPLQGFIALVLTMGMIFYCSNDSVKRRKEWEQSKSLYAGQLAAIQASSLIEEKKEISLDRRLQSIEGIIGYLDQSIKMGQEPKALTPIMLSLAKEIKTIRDKK